MITDILAVVKRLLAAVWTVIKKVATIIARFVRNVVEFFKQPSRLDKLKENKNSIAISIKEKLDSGDYQIVNCLFDQQESELIDPDTDAEIISASEIDAEMAERFGDKSMLVLK